MLHGLTDVQVQDNTIRLYIFNPMIAQTHPPNMITTEVSDNDTTATDMTGQAPPTPARLPVFCGRGQTVMLPAGFVMYSSHRKEVLAM